MSTKVTSVLNNSISKESHSFAKSQRFPEPRCYTANCKSTTYNKMSDFDLTVRKGNGRTRYDFGSRLGRFNFSYVPKTNTRVGPTNYTIQDSFTKSNPALKSSNVYTFGVSRASMCKKFIEAN